MRYLESIERSDDGLVATFTNGETTSSKNAAVFFGVMEEMGIQTEELQDYIKHARLFDPDREWNEIDRIVNTLGENAMRERRATPDDLRRIHIQTPHGFIVPGMSSDSPEELKAKYAKVMRKSWEQLEADGYRVVSPPAKHVDQCGARMKIARLLDPHDGGGLTEEDREFLEDLDSHLDERLTSEASDRVDRIWKDGSENG